MPSWPRRTRSVTVDYDVAIPMQDNVVLRAEVFRPSGGERCPVVILRTPYERHQGSMFGNQVNAVHLAAAGYAVVVQDVRGRFGSEGDFYPFRHEGADGVDTITWAAEQSWSTGEVGTVGSSYLGYDQVLAARERPEALKAWAPAFSTLDARDGWVYEQDKFCLGFNLSWTLVVMSGDLRTRDTGEILTALRDWNATIKNDLACLSEVDQPSGSFFLDWLKRKDDPGYWSSMSGHGVEACEAPSFQIGGWFDLFNRGTFALHDALGGGTAGGDHRLVVGPWDHSALPPGTGSGESDFGPHAGFDLTGAHRKWFDWLLRGESRPDWPAANIFLTGANRWESFDTWPPPEGQVDFHLGPSQSLDECDQQTGEDRFITDSFNPTPTVGGRLCCAPFLLPMGQRLQNDRSERSDVIRYRSEPASEDRPLLGPVDATIWSTSDRETGDVHLTLVDIDECGNSWYLADGIARMPTDRNSPIRFDIDLGHIGHVLQHGHRLGADIAGMSFPRFDRVPSSGLARRSILAGGEFDSRIRIGQISDN